uniref:Uncharacterized protein LOC109682299 n=1 Tax=Castor canadensis TaxID=51338 RepID=A0A8B7U5P2_CASCN|nr:uncharacterized protein LOC109682299 [Castor canadensis]
MGLGAAGLPPRFSLTSGSALIHRLRRLTLRRSAQRLPDARAGWPPEHRGSPRPSSEAASTGTDTEGGRRWRTGEGLFELPAGGPLRATLFRPFGAEGRAVGSLGRRRAGLPGPAGSRDRRGLRSGGRTREAAVTADGEVAARRGTSGCPLGLSRRRRKMAEASAAGTDAGATVAAHRFFCHFCKGEVSPKLPEYICPRCESGFIEEVTDDSRIQS